MSQTVQYFDRQLFIRYKGLYDFDGLYKFMAEWFRTQNYRWYETRYKNKLYTPMGNEFEVNWEAEKEVTEFVKYIIKIHFHTFDAKEVEVNIDGKPQKRMTGRIQIGFDCFIILDWQDRYTGSKFKEVLYSAYVNILSKWDLEAAHYDPCAYQMMDLMTRMKKFIGIQTADSAYPSML